jgi:hypothetical protein
MALPGITCPEKFVLPLYFQKDQQGDLLKLFQKDSILEHLLDPWKPEAVKSISYEDSSLVKYMHTHFLSLKSPIFANLKQYKDKFNEIIKQISSGTDIYLTILQDSFIKTLTGLDNEVMISILKYYAILEEHKRLFQVKYQHISSAVSLKTKIEKVNRRLTDLSFILKYETYSGIVITKLDPNSPQFSRCDKAVCENAKSQVFKGTNYSSLKLCSAFKIENSSLLKSFEKKVKNSENSTLKGLFISVNKKQLPGVCIFGPQSDEFIKSVGSEYYFKNYLRIPSEYIGKNKIDEFIKTTEGFPAEILASSNSTLIKDHKKIRDASNCIISLILCRAIISKSKNDPGFNPDTQEFKINDFTTVYPEYILICTKEKSFYEVVPQQHLVIPVKLTDLNYSNSISNKMSVETFYNYINKAFEQSQSQRNKLRNELAGLFDGFWNAKYSKQALVNTIIESKKKFAEKTKNEIEALRKELAALQRHTESLKQIKNIRCKSS